MHRAGDDPGHELTHLAHAVGFGRLGRAVRPHHRRGDLGVALERGGGAGEDVDDAFGRRAPDRGPLLDPLCQRADLLDHRLEQQPLLRGEVAVDGAEGDVGLGGDVPHLHCLEPAPLGQPDGGVEHPAAAGGLVAGERVRRRR